MNHHDSTTPTSPFSTSRPLHFTPVETAVSLFYQSCMGLIYIFALITNIMAIYIFLNKNSKSSSENNKKITTAKVLYASISLSDEIFLLSALVATFISSNSVTIRITHISGYVSTYTMALIAFHRYRAIAFPIQNRPTRSVRWNVLFCIIFIWICSTILVLFSTKYIYDPRLELIKDEQFLLFCVSISDPALATKDVPYFTLISMVFIPLGVGATFSLLAVKEINQKCLHFVSEVQQKNKLRSTIMILVVICTFAICWIPVSLFLAVEGSNVENRGFCDYNYFLYLALIGLLMIEFMANPIIYWVMNPTFRKGAEMLWRQIRNKINCVFRRNYSQNTQRVVIDSSASSSV